MFISDQTASLSESSKVTPIRKGISPEFAYIKQLFHGFKYQRVIGTEDINVFKLALCESKLESGKFCCRPVALQKYTVHCMIPVSDSELQLARLSPHQGEIPMEGLVNDITMQTQCVVCWNHYINLLRR